MNFVLVGNTLSVLVPFNPWRRMSGHPTEKLHCGTDFELSILKRHLKSNEKVSLGYGLEDILQLSLNLHDTYCDRLLVVI